MKTVAIQGVMGAFSHAAAIKLFDKEAEIHFKAKFKEVLDSVILGECEYGVLPIENSTAGLVVEVQELLKTYNVSVISETTIPVVQCLLGKPGARIEDIKKVISHRQALSQCSQFLQAHSEIKAQEFSNTAAAAKFAAESPCADIAAIAGEDCAEIYGLKILAKGIQDNEKNKTRFVCIQKYNFSNRIQGVTGEAITEIFDLLKKPEIISFAGGLPATETLPATEIDEICKRLFSRYALADILQYGATRGHAVLLSELRKFFAVKSIDAGDENLIVLAGGQQCIDYMCKVFVNAGDVVLVQDPTYLSVLQIVQTYEGRCVGVASAPDGLDIADLEAKIVRHKPRFLYVVPTFSNPTGESFSQKNRALIAQVASRYNLCVLEDDPYAEIRFEGAPIPTIKSFDKTGNVIYLQSFSKIVAPALRLAAVVGAKQIIEKFLVAKQSTDVCAPSVDQLVLAEFLKTELKAHLGKIIPIYKRKRDAMAAALKKYMPKQFKFEIPKGGLFIWGRLPGQDLLKAFPMALRRNVAYLPGVYFFADGKGRDTMRLNFSNAALGQIESGIKALGQLFGGKL
jgi:2-aminoadipate transaminase